MKIRKVWLTASITLVASTLVFSACGEDSSSSEEPSQATSPKAALAEVEATRQGLDQALDTYTAGNEAAAVEQATETYLQHFELVEGPLEEVDHELTEELEDTIREDLISAMKAGDSVADVKALSAEINAGLDEAAQALRSS